MHWRKIELDPIFLQKIAGPERWGLEKYRRISRVQNEEMKRRKDDEVEEGKLVKENDRTLRMVLS